MKDFTLSIVSHDQGAMLVRLLTDLKSVSDIEQAKIVITLNVPGEPFDESAFKGLDLSIIRNSSCRGFGANHNAAFAQCGSEWFAVLNPDLRLPEDPFRALLDRGREDCTLGALAPVVVDSSGRAEDHVRPNLTPLSLWRRRCKIAEQVDIATPSVFPSRFYWLAGMFILFRADAFRSIGGFDTRFFLYCEDYDVCARLYCSGYGATVVPNVRAIHDAQRQSHRSVRHLAWHLRSLSRLWLSSSFWSVTMRKQLS